MHDYSPKFLFLFHTTLYYTNFFKLSFGLFKFSFRATIAKILCIDHHSDLFKWTLKQKFNALFVITKNFGEKIINPKFEVKQISMNEMVLVLTT